MPEINHIPQVVEILLYVFAAAIVYETLRFCWHLRLESHKPLTQEDNHISHVTSSTGSVSAKINYKQSDPNKEIGEKRKIGNPQDVYGPKRTLKGRNDQDKERQGDRKRSYGMKSRHR